MQVQNGSDAMEMWLPYVAVASVYASHYRFCCCGCPWLTLSHLVPMKIFKVLYVLQCFAEVGTMESVGPMLFHLQTCVSSAPTQLSLLLDALAWVSCVKRARNCMVEWYRMKRLEKGWKEHCRLIPNDCKGGLFLWVLWMDQHTHSA